MPSEIQHDTEHKPKNKMSLEDLTLDFQSDESDYEAEKNCSDCKNDDDDESDYLELVHLHNNLKSFEHIYFNNTKMDMQHMEEEEILQSFDSDSEDLEWSLYQDYLASALDTFLSTSPSVTSHGDGPSSDIENSVLSILQDFVQLYEEVVTTFSSSTSPSSSTPSSAPSLGGEPSSDTDDTSVQQHSEFGSAV